MVWGELLYGIGRYYDSVLTLFHGKTRAAFIWNGVRKEAIKTRFELATGAFHWHDWGGPGRGSAPEAPEHGCGTLCPVFLLPDLSGPVFSLVSSVFLSPCSS